MIVSDIINFLFEISYKNNDKRFLFANSLSNNAWHVMEYNIIF